MSWLKSFSVHVTCTPIAAWSVNSILMHHNLSIRKTSLMRDTESDPCPRFLGLACETRENLNSTLQFQWEWTIQTLLCPIQTGWDALLLRWPSYKKTVVYIAIYAWYSYMFKVGLPAEIHDEMDEKTPKSWWSGTPTNIATPAIKFYMACTCNTLSLATFDAFF